MGAWGTDSFDNDDAVDWIHDFTDAPSTQFIKETFQTVTKIGDDYLEAPQSSMALAAAEVVAALNGAPHPHMPESLQAYLQDTQLHANQPLIDLALIATERIKTHSELKELWEENTTEYATWYAAVTELQTRLKQKL